MKSILLFLSCLWTFSYALRIPQPRATIITIRNTHKTTVLSTSSSSTNSNNEITDLDGNVESTSNDMTGLHPIQKALKILYKFSRPHTIKGTILASSMSVTRALIENPTKISTKLIPKALIGLFALLCGNAYIVGINQIYDVKIDEVNKPFLPIAAKLMSSNRAWQLITTCVILGISIVKLNFSPHIFALYSLGLLFGTLYSVPPFHLKRFPILAGLIIATVRGFLLNFGVYYAVREALNIPFKWNPVVCFISSFMTIFASVIAITKDLPDIEGDKKFNVDTFANKYGIKTVANSASAVLGLAYIGAIILGISSPSSFQPLPMIGGHIGLLGYFLYSFKQLDTSKMTSVKQYYKAIWNLFYMEYCLYPFI